MDDFAQQDITVSSAVRKKRSSCPRRPHPDPKSILQFPHGLSLLNGRGRYEDISLLYRNESFSIGVDLEQKIGNDEIDGDRLKGFINQSDLSGYENKLKKLKLKLGGVIRTIHTKPVSVVGVGSASSSLKALDTNLTEWTKLEKDNKCLTSHGAGSTRQRFSRLDVTGEHASNSEPVRKSRRVPKRRALDEEFNEYDDEEIQYLWKLRAAKASVSCGHKLVDRDLKSRTCSGSCVGTDTIDDNKNDRKKLRMPCDVAELSLEDELGDKLKKVRRNPDASVMGCGQELVMTTRRQALQSGKVVFSVAGDGLPAVHPKRQKTALSEVEQQFRKAEAAERRKLQAEKAAREAEAGAIRKILGQDSIRKKKEGKLKKQLEELAQEKTAKAMTLGPKTVRWVIGPSGTVVTFSNDIGLPSIFGSLPCGYPPAREKCAGPNCTNVYKYRDSQSKLPLCSLNCYKAVQSRMEVSSGVFRPFCS